MIINKGNVVINGKNFEIGGLVVPTSDSEYAGLIGVIEEIRSGQDKETENLSDDIIVNFFQPESEKVIKKLEENFSNLYRQEKKLNDIILDYVVFSADEINPYKIDAEGVLNLDIAQEVIKSYMSNFKIEKDKVIFKNTVYFSKSKGIYLLESRLFHVNGEMLDAGVYILDCNLNAVEKYIDDVWEYTDDWEEIENKYFKRLKELLKDDYFDDFQKTVISFILNEFSDLETLKNNIIDKDYNETRDKGINLDSILNLETFDKYKFEILQIYDSNLNENREYVEEHISNINPYSLTYFAIQEVAYNLLCEIKFI